MSEGQRNRFVLFPIEYPEVWEKYKQAVQCFWTAEECDFAQDVKDLETLTDNERFFIENVLAFFAGADGIVNENLAQRFMSDVDIAEAKCFYGWQIAMENVHAETYSLMIDTFVKSQERKNELFSAVMSDGAVGLKAQWALKWLSGDQPFVQRLFAFACVEGIFFSGSFCAIFWLKKRNLMPGLCYSNELISRDEGLHCDFACLLVRILGLDTSELLPILVEAVTIEHEYVRESIRVNLIGMNADSMCSYIEFVADRLLVAIGLPKHYNTANPFEWMELISLQNKTNFFEKRVSEYSRALGRSTDGVSSGGSGSEKVFSLEEDF